MAKPIGKRAAYRAALLNAAALIETEDLESLFAELSDEFSDDESWERLEQAQMRVAALLRKAAGGCND